MLKVQNFTVFLLLSSSSLKDCVKNMPCVGCNARVVSTAVTRAMIAGLDVFMVFLTCCVDWSDKAYIKDFLF